MLNPLIQLDSSTRTCISLLFYICHQFLLQFEALNIQIWQYTVNGHMKSSFKMIALALVLSLFILKSNHQRFRGNLTLFLGCHKCHSNLHIYCLSLYVFIKHCRGYYSEGCLWIVRANMIQKGHLNIIYQYIKRLLRKAGIKCSFFNSVILSLPSHVELSHSGYSKILLFLAWNWL